MVNGIKVLCAFLEKNMATLAIGIVRQVVEQDNLSAAALAVDIGDYSFVWHPGDANKFWLAVR